MLQFYEEAAEKQRKADLAKAAGIKQPEKGDEEKAKDRQRKQVYDSLKNLLTQLSFSPEGPLVAL